MAGPRPAAASMAQQVAQPGLSNAAAAAAAPAASASPANASVSAQLRPTSNQSQPSQQRQQQPARTTASAAAAAAAGLAPQQLTELDMAALALDEADAITSVRLDGLALTKIVKHSRDAHPASAIGVLMGLDIGGALEVSNVFALPGGVLRQQADGGSGGGDDEEERGAKSATRYTSEMIKLLRDVNADANPVGLYRSCFLGAFLSSAVLENLAAVAAMMEKEGANGKGKGVLVVHDLASSAAGNLSVRAYRLSPAFIDAYRTSAPKFTTSSLINHKLTFANVLVEIPLSLHNTALLDAFLSGLAVPTLGVHLGGGGSNSGGGASSSRAANKNTSGGINTGSKTVPPPTTAEALRNPAHSPLGGASAPPTSLLTLAHTPVLTSSLEKTLEALDDHLSDASNVGYQLRQLARERQRVESQAARRRAENAAREAQGLSALPVEDAASQLRALALREPSRLEGLSLLGALDESAARLAELGGNASVGLYAAKTGAV